MPWSALANVAGSVIGAITGVQQQKKEQAFNAEQAQINRDFQTAERESTQQFNVDMWNMNNEYNSPASQLKRLQDAGISPNALFGTGASPYQSSAVTSNPMSGSLAQTNSGLGSALVNAGSSLGVNTANMLKALSERDTNEYNLKWNRMTEPQRLEMMNSEIEKNWSQVQNFLADAGVKNATKEQVLELNKYIAPLKKAELRKMNAELQNLYATYRKTLSEKGLIDQQTKTEEQRTELVGSQRVLADEQAYKTFQESFAVEMQNNFSMITGIPVNADSFQVAYAMWQQGAGEFENYINNFVIPQHRASWKHDDFKHHDDNSESGSISAGAGSGPGSSPSGGISGSKSKSSSYTYDEYPDVLNDNHFSGGAGNFQLQYDKPRWDRQQGVNFKNPSTLPRLYSPESERYYKFRVRQNKYRKRWKD